VGNDGYIKIWRRLFEHPIWLNSTPEQKNILIVLIELANYSDCQWEWQGKEFSLKRGQMITSTASIMRACGKGVSEQNVKTALVRFEKFGFLTCESTKTGRLITIENYDKWQGECVESNQESNQDLTDTSPRPNQDLTTKKNNKKNKKDKKYIYPALGEFKNILLSEEELEKLKARFPYDWQELIERLSRYMKSKGKRYKSHYATMLSWARKDEIDVKSGKNSSCKEPHRTSEKDYSADGSGFRT